MHGEENQSITIACFVLWSENKLGYVVYALLTFHNIFARLNASFCLIGKQNETDIIYATLPGFISNMSASNSC